ncbi:hypothetical protein SDC9_81899 [bioreactor metagenome]|uniref:DUF2292 domain-containing protein n=1 Tax=bioreactor metagenome TaxID=1076179 RepID=A0A644Z422_9ZZZZ
MKNKGDNNDEHKVLLERLLPQIKCGTLTFVIQDNRVIQINVTARETEERNYAETICVS